MPSQPVVYCFLPRTGIIFMSAAIGCWELFKSFFYFFVLRNTFKHKTFFYMVSYLGRFITLLSAFGFLYSCYISYKRNFKPYNRLLHLFTANLAFDAFNLIWIISDIFNKSINRDHLKNGFSDGIMRRSGAIYDVAQNSTMYNNTMNHLLNSTILNGTLADGTTINGTLLNETFISIIMSNGTMLNRTVQNITFTRTGKGTTTQEDADITANVMAHAIYFLVPLLTCLFFLVPFFNKLYFVARIHSYVNYVLYKKEEAQPPTIDMPHKLPECSK